jgi:hypothetical protein
MTPAELRREIQLSLLEVLADSGFFAKGRLVLRRRAALATDWLAVAVTGRRNGPIDATINVGIHCAPMHRLLAELDGEKYTETVATFCTNIGYLEASPGFREWAFGRAALDHGLLHGLAGTVKTVALPFLEQFADASSVRRGCERYGFKEYNLLRLPALEVVAGHLDEARTLLASATRSVQSRSDAAAEHLRVAAGRLARRLE